MSARVELPKGASADTDHVALRTGGADVPAQYSVASRWDDQSVRALEMDFNVSLGPGESRAYQIAYGPEINRPASVPRGLTLVEEADAVQVGNIRFGRNGAPLVLSANYRGEFMGKTANGFTVADAAGARHDLVGAQPIALDIVKRGPLLVVLKYTGRIPIDAAYSAPFTITCEMPNSKSWLKASIAIEDPSRRVTSLSFESPLTLGEKPWIWDFGTDTGTYGALRGTGDAVLLSQTVSSKGNNWTVQTGSQNELRPYESSIGSRAKTASGWGHLYDASRAVAFAVDRFASEPGTYSIALNGQGHAVFTLTPAQSKTSHRLTVYQHFVPTPVPVGAATNPTAMLNPLVVKVN